MHAAQLLPVFVVGLAGSIHCVGMCGGIVGALSGSARRAPSLSRSVIPIAVARASAAAGGTSSTAGAVAAPASTLARVLAYNAGRIASYMLVGAIAGALGGGAQGVAALTGMAGAQLLLYWLANLMLVALGLYLMNAWRGLAWLEQGGRLLWQRAQPAMAPLMRTLLPAERPQQAFALGALWGWLPCGMVYSVLLTAMLSGSAPDGALVMLAFGLGTLPMLTSLGLLGARLQAALRHRAMRITCGVLVLGFGLLGLARAMGGFTPAWMELLCLTPH